MLKHCFQKIIDCLNLPIRLRVVWSRALMGEAQLGSQFKNHVIPEIFPMAFNYSMWYTIPYNAMIEEKKAVVSPMFLYVGINSVHLVK